MSRITLALAALSLSLASLAQAAGPPLISNTAATQVGETSATIAATVNPEEKPTKYQLDYVDEAGYEAEGFANPTKAPASPPTIPAGDKGVPVSVQIEGLTPATTYHYRLRASSPSGPTVGPERTFTTHLPPPLFDPCPNDAFRTDLPSAHLPDCRAYEQASPVQKNGGHAIGFSSFVQATPTGDGITFMSDAGFPGGEGSQELPLYLASRGAGGWFTEGLLPPAATGQKAHAIGWLPDFSAVFDEATKLTEPEETTLLRRPSDGGPLETIVDYIPNLAPRYAGASADGSKMIFEADAKLTPAALEGDSNLYAWDRDSGEISLASVLNDGQSPPQGAFAGPYDWVQGTSPATLATGGTARSYYLQEQRAVTPEGSLSFTAAGTGQLYLRLNPTEPQSALDIEGNCTEAAKACTIHVSATKKTNGLGLGGADAAGTQPAAFMGASKDGTKTFFTSSEKLTNDATTGPEPEPAAIARAGIGGSPTQLDFLPASAKGIAVDGSHVYWADPKAGTIGRATLDGQTEVDPSFIEAPVKPQWVTTDSEHVYWTDAVDGQNGNGTIGRAELDGEEVKPSFITGAHNPQGIAVNTTHIYWANAGSGTVFPFLTKGIARATIEGGEVIQPWTVDEGGEPLGYDAAGLALDATYLYFTEGNNGNLVRITLAEPKERTSLLFTGTSDRFRGIAVAGDRLYWADEKNDVIGRAKLNNPGAITEVELEFVKGARHPQGLAVDPTHIHWSANQEVVPNAGNDLYRYDHSATGEKLSDLVLDTDDANGADVQGVLGISQDGTHVYFAANGDLDGGGPATPGNCEGPVAGGSGNCNLYLWREMEGGGAQISFIARLDAGGDERTSDTANWSASATPRMGLTLNWFQKTSRVSPDGQTLLFRSQEKLSEYENEGVPQFYRYRVGEGLSCVSCNPSGAAPSGTPRLARMIPAALIPARGSALTTRNLSADGERVFFETTDALVGADVNGLDGCPRSGSESQVFPTCLDVYMWEAEGFWLLRRHLLQRRLSLPALQRREQRALALRRRLRERR